MRTSGAISIAACAKRLDVDNRIALRYYYRIARNLLKQADIYRAETNLIDLYIMLLRFSSLITETIPFHKDYNLTLKQEKTYFRTKLIEAISEMEGLKSVVQNRVEELNRKHRSQVNKWEHKPQNVANTYYSTDYRLYDRKSSSSHNSGQAHVPFAYNGLGRESGHYNSDLSSSIMNSDSFKQIIARPKEETLSRHSILGPNGLRGQWQPPSFDRGVQYPTNLDVSPIKIPSFHKPAEEELTTKNESASVDTEKSMLESVLSLDDGRWSVQAENTNLTTKLDSSEALVPNIPRELSPPPVLADVKNVVHHSCPITGSNTDPAKLLQDQLVPSESPLQLHISTQVMDTFMRVAKSNTDRNLETCGILAGLLKNRKFYVTALIIPKQEATSDSCQTTNEEEIFDVQDKQSLFPLGWIHTHPTQSCFMSSIDLHTHYSYQIMLPEAIAIVMAPKDSSRKHGMFRLTTPGGMTVIRQCQQRGFHPHDQPADGGPIYNHCTDVFMNPKVEFDVIDLR